MILLLVFNRPDHTRRVVERLRALRPPALYVSADGPRPRVPADADRCAAVRAIFEREIDWPCRVHTQFLPENLGCRRAVQAGISWFFQHVEEGIILEDDCMPDLSFFPFCTQLLERYRHDPQVMHIAGSNPAPDACAQWPASYLFSRFSFIWGWATWRRAWQQYDPQFTDLEQQWADPRSAFSRLLPDRAARRYLLDKFLRVRDGVFDTWDYAWFYSVVRADGLCIVPKVNLVRNIGFDDAATHTSAPAGKRHAQEAVAMPFPLVHPAQRQPVPVLEKAFFHASQKDPLRLWLRRLAPALFYRKTPRLS